MKLGTLALVAFAGLTASLNMGCLLGCDPGNNSQRAPVEFAPATVQATRTPSTCGVVDPAFTASDSFALELDDGAGTDMQVTLAGAVEQEVVQPLMVNADGSAQSTDGSIRFAFANGSDPTALEGFPVSSVVVTPTALPSSDGQQLGVELSVTYEDGRVLDQVYSGALQTVSFACK